jgi:anti-anti-sigma factor
MITFKIPARLDVVTSADTETQLTRLLNDENPDTLVCDFSETEYVSSAGLRIILLITKQMKNAGGHCILCGMKKAVHEVFHMVGFDTVMDIRDSMD